MYLSKDKKQTIASLFNSAMYNRTVWFEKVDDGDFEKADVFKLDYAWAVLTLADDYGIELAGLSSCRAWINEWQAEVLK